MEDIASEGGTMDWSCMEWSDADFFGFLDSLVDSESSSTTPHNIKVQSYALRRRSDDFLPKPVNLLVSINLHLFSCPDSI